MKRILFLLIFFGAFTFNYGQSFEGKLTYKVAFELEIDSLKKIGIEMSRKQIIERLKHTGEYHDTITVTLKKGDYLKEYNSRLLKKVLYKSDSNKIYTFQNNSNHETVLNLKAVNSILNRAKTPKIKKVDSLKVIHGINCKLITLNTIDEIGKEYYFYNSDVATLDPAVFKYHKYEYFNSIVEQTNAYPLEIVKPLSPFFSVRMTLVSISKEKVSNQIFDIEKIKSKKPFFDKKTTNWRSYTDQKIGYTLEYPENWVASSTNDGFMCGLKDGFENAEYTLYWSQDLTKEEIEQLFSSMGPYKDYDITEKPININGLDGVHYLKTLKENPNKYCETIALKKKSFWYILTSSGVKNNWFKHFYKSFTLIE